MSLFGGVANRVYAVWYLTPICSPKATWNDSGSASASMVSSGLLFKRQAAYRYLISSASVRRELTVLPRNRRERLGAGLSRRPESEIYFVDLE